MKPLREIALLPSIAQDDSRLRSRKRRKIQHLNTDHSSNKSAMCLPQWHFTCLPTIQIGRFSATPQPQLSPCLSFPPQVNLLRDYCTFPISTPSLLPSSSDLLGWDLFPIFLHCCFNCTANDLICQTQWAQYSPCFSSSHCSMWSVLKFSLHLASMVPSRFSFYRTFSKQTFLLLCGCLFLCSGLKLLSLRALLLALVDSLTWLTFSNALVTTSDQFNLPSPKISSVAY